MEATLTSEKAFERETHVESAQERNTGFYARFMERAEFDRFSIISIGFLLIGIFGGITIGFFAHDHIWQIGIVAGFTMLSLSLMLAVAPMKYILRATAAALIVDVLIMLINLV